MGQGKSKEKSVDTEKPKCKDSSYVFGWKEYTNL